MQNIFAVQTRSDERALKIATEHVLIDLSQSQAETSAQETRDHSPRAELKIDDFEVLGDSRAKKGNRTAPEPTPPPSSDTAADQSRDSSDSNTSRTSTDSSASLVESKNRTVARNVASDVKVKRYFKAPEGTWHMLDLDTGRSAIDIPKKEVPEREPESKNSTLTMPRTTSGKFTTINGNHTVPDRAINRNPPNSVHVTSHDALYFVHERDARATWIYSLSGPPTNQSANSVSKGALKIVMSVLSRDRAEISDDSTARQTFTLQFRHPPSCHVLNRSTARHELEDNKPKIELELLIGFKSGDILLHDPIRKSFTKHFNKGVSYRLTCVLYNHSFPFLESTIARCSGEAVLAPTTSGSIFSLVRRHGALRAEFSEQQRGHQASESGRKFVCDRSEAH